MSIQHRTPARTALARDATGTAIPLGAKVLAGLRIVMGLTFLWAFADKTFGLGYSTGLRLAAIGGGTLLAFMWIAEWPPARQTSSGAASSSSNPLIDYHLVYLVVLIALAVYAAGNTWGYGRQWAKLDIVRRCRWLR